MSLLRPARTQRRAGAPPGAQVAGNPEPDAQRGAPSAQGAGGWSFTARALQAMAALAISVAEVVAVVERPATVRPSRRADGQVATRGGIMVVHDRAGRCVLSVVREHQSPS